MARPQVRLAMLLVLLMLMAGCIFASTPEWGTGDGQLKVEIDDDTAHIQSKLGDGFDEEVSLIGCGVENTKIKVTGMLISSRVYNAHLDDNSIESAMGAAVIIHKMTWSQAESIEEGAAGRVNLKNWDSPTLPMEAVGSKISTNEDDWAVIGIVPASENIADGLNVLEHWHQPIELSGYILDSKLQTAIDDKCVVEGQGHGMVITNIRTAEGEVSIDGDSDDEYYLGDTDVFGRWSFILFFLIAGVGGGVGLFIVSTMVIRQGAKATAEALLGREGLAKAVQMKRDLRASKKSGLESSAERAVKEKKRNPPPEKKSNDEVAIPGFSLDNVLSSGERDGSPKTFGGGSVVVTSEAQEMQPQSVVSPPVTEKAPMHSTNVVSSQPESVSKRGHFSTTVSGNQITNQPSKSAPPTAASKPVKRRSVKKRAVTQEEPEPEPTPVAQNKTSSVADDDDFSDFSF